MNNKGNELVLYHGSPDKQIVPTYGLGNDKHDYGKGFYLTGSPVLASEWSVCNPIEKNGWVHKFVLDTSELKILDFENNITCDNPNLFECEDGSYEAVMGCNCSNTQVGYALDLLSVIIAEMAFDIVGLCDKNPQAEAMLDQLRGMTMQVSADSIPTKGGQEDHVEFSYSAALKADRGVDILSNLMKVLRVY